MRINKAPNVIIIAITLFFGVIQANCGDSGSGDNQNNDSGVVERANLEIVPPPGQDVGLRPGGEATLRVRYTDAEFVPIAGMEAGPPFVLRMPPPGRTASLK